MIRRTVFHICITMAVLLAGPSWAQEDALNGDQIKLIFIGNTMEYVARDETIKVYFEPGGGSKNISLSKPDKLARRTWWIKNGNALCRTVRKNAVHCVKVYLGPKPDVYTLVNLKGTKTYLAMILAGDQLRNSERQAASETDKNTALRGDRIKQILVGNTMEFDSSRGSFKIYFKGNGMTRI